MAARLGIYVRDDTVERLAEVRQLHGIANGALLDAVMLCMSEAELDNLVERFERAKKLEAKMGGELPRDMRINLRGKPAGSIQQITTVVLQSRESQVKLLGEPIQ